MFRRVKMTGWAAETDRQYGVFMMLQSYALAESYMLQ